MSHAFCHNDVVCIINKRSTGEDSQVRSVLPCGTRQTRDSRRRWARHTSRPAAAAASDGPHLAHTTTLTQMTINRMLEMTSDTPTNAEMHVTSNIASARSQ